MSFRELEQKHNLVNMVILACGKHPTSADINPLLEERLERFYEDAIIEGMAKQMHSSVDRAVNLMGKKWSDLTDDEIKDIKKGLSDFMKKQPPKPNLKEKNND